MKLIIVRHGQASDGIQDDERVLTQRGKEEAHSAGVYLKSLDTDPQYIIHSKKERSVQTARIIAEILDATDRLCMQESAGPEGSINDILEIVLNSEGPVILVSHMPFVYILSSFLLSDNAVNNHFRFQTGAMLILDRSADNRWTASKFINPANIGI